GLAGTCLVSGLLMEAFMPVEVIQAGLRQPTNLTNQTNPTMPRPRSEPIRWTTSMDKQQGRDELRTGEMWNSNSLISWLLARAGIDTEGLEPPVGGRAPGWNAGVVVAGRQMQHRTP
ncbi:MAG: hypothetical protein ACJ75N_21100, partial [Actinomycetes bacterium]